MLFNYTDYAPPESFFAKPGYDELIVYSDSIEDTPSFTDIDVKNLMRVKSWNLYPKYNSEVDTDLINGLPDRNMFSVTPVALDGTCTVDLGATLDYHIDYVTARLFEHMRQAWMGIRNDGSLVSPREEWIAEHPWFSLGSAYHGAFVQCLVNKFTLNIKSDGPVEIEWELVATNYRPDQVFTFQNMRPLMELPKYEQYRKIIYGRDFLIDSETGGVVGHFGLQDASGSIFAEGVNKPVLHDDTISSFSLTFNNRLEPQYTMHSENIVDPRARLEENMFPDCYGNVGQREITGSIEWFGNSNPLTFIERIMGPGAIQGGGQMNIRSRYFDIILKEITWKLSTKDLNLTDKMQRRADFSSVSDGWLIIPYYTADFS